MENFKQRFLIVCRRIDACVIREVKKKEEKRKAKKKKGKKERKAKKRQRKKEEMRVAALVLLSRPFPPRTLFFSLSRAEPEENFSKVLIPSHSHPS